MGNPDASPDWKGTNWYRFVPPAGTKLPDRPPATSMGGCDTTYQGWIQGINPQFIKFCSSKEF